MLTFRLCRLWDFDEGDGRRVESEEWKLYMFDFFYPADEIEKIISNSNCQVGLSTMQFAAFNVL